VEASRLREEEGEERVCEAKAAGACRLALQDWASDNLRRWDGPGMRARRVGGGGRTADSESRGERIER
jgi:hypothetical protein